MNITEHLLKLDPSLSWHSEGRWDVPIDLDDTGFSSFNDAGVECEVGELLYAFIRILKPNQVLETGTHKGIGAAYLGMALKHNNHGSLDTVEFIPELRLEAEKRMTKLGLNEIVTCHLIDARLFIPSPGNYEFIFLDTEPQTRFEELIRYYRYLNPGGYVFIHDLHRHMQQIENEEHGFAWPFGKMPNAILDLVRSGQLRPFHFPTPRGLVGFYKPMQEDYQWHLNLPKKS